MRVASDPRMARYHKCCCAKHVLHLDTLSIARRVPTASPNKSVAWGMPTRPDADMDVAKT